MPVPDARAAVAQVIDQRLADVGRERQPLVTVTACRARSTRRPASRGPTSRSLATSHARTPSREHQQDRESRPHRRGPIAAANSRATSSAASALGNVAPPAAAAAAPRRSARRRQPSTNRNRNRPRSALTSRHTILAAAMPALPEHERGHLARRQPVEATAALVQPAGQEQARSPLDSPPPGSSHRSDRARAPGTRQSWRRAAPPDRTPPRARAPAPIPGVANSQPAAALPIRESHSSCEPLARIGARNPRSPRRSARRLDRLRRHPQAQPAINRSRLTARSRRNPPRSAQQKTVRERQQRPDDPDRS